MKSKYKCRLTDDNERGDKILNGNFSESPKIYSIEQIHTRISNDFSL